MTEDGQETTYVSYAVDLKPEIESSLKGVAKFVLEALQSGHVEAASPIVTPGYQVESDGTHATVLFFFQRPEPR